MVRSFTNVVNVKNALPTKAILVFIRVFHLLNLLFVEVNIYKLFAIMMANTQRNPFACRHVLVSHGAVLLSSCVQHTILTNVQRFDVLW